MNLLCWIGYLLALAFIDSFSGLIWSSLVVYAPDHRSPTLSWIHRFASVPVVTYDSFNSLGSVRQQISIYVLPILSWLLVQSQIRVLFIPIHLLYHRPLRKLYYETLTPGEAQRSSCLHFFGGYCFQCFLDIYSTNVSIKAACNIRLLSNPIDWNSSLRRIGYRVRSFGIFHTM